VGTIHGGGAPFYKAKEVGRWSVWSEVASGGGKLLQ
jgi:hypothetical protein